MTTAREEYYTLQKRVDGLLLSTPEMLSGKTISSVTASVTAEVYIEGFVFTDGTFACIGSEAESDEVYLPMPGHSLDAASICLVSVEYYEDLWKRIHAEDYALRNIPNKAQRLARYKQLLEFKKNGVFDD